MGNAIIGGLSYQDFAIEFSFKLTTATLNMYFLGKMTNTVDYAIRLDAADADIMKFDFFQTDDTDRTQTIVPSLATAGIAADSIWHKCSLRMDFTSTQLLTCQIDGVERSSIDVSTWSGLWRLDVASVFCIGADGKDGTNILTGAIDGVAIYLSLLSDANRLSTFQWWSTNVSAGSVDGYGTPLSSSSASNGTKTYKFTTSDAPALPESGILRIVNQITEKTSKLNPQAGLASRGSGSVIMIDVKGDPNLYAPEVTEDVIAASTYLAKMDARNIMVNKSVRIKNYRVESDGTVDLVNGAETRHYLIESFNNLGNDKWDLRFKDELSRVNIGETVWPLPLEGSLRVAVNETTTTIPVDANVTYLVADTIRIGDELMKVTAVANIGTGTASLTVQTRGNNISYTNTLSQTVADSHEIDDEIYVCDVSDNEDIDVFLKRVLVDIGVDATYIADADWAAEMADWHPTDKINTLWIEAEDTFDIIKRVLAAFLLDMWFDPVAREIKLTAISQWRLSSSTVTEGIEIDYDTIKRKKEENLRFTRGLVVYDKRFLASDNSVENFNKAALFSRADLEVADFYGEAKTKRFEPSSLLTKQSASLLVNRYVSRNVDPFSYKWLSQESRVNFSVGDVLNIVTDAGVKFNGQKAEGARAQITEIKPKYTKYGREYFVSALSYEAVAETGSQYIISGNVRNIDIHTYVGAPNLAVEVTIIIDGATVGSSDLTPSLVGGAFASGSKIIIILANGADITGRGGDGGKGGEAEWDFESNTSFLSSGANGKAGGTAYDAQGVDTDIYFSGATPSTSYPTALGVIAAPSGGDGGAKATEPSLNTKPLTTGDGGDGGAGRDGGSGGEHGPSFLGRESTIVLYGDSGALGLITDTLGIVGSNTASSTGGAAGSGVIDNGATVVFFPTTPSGTEYINGNGDH